ncbi:multicopper oxidase domain-containing protein [Rhizobium tibeticum]|nr:multicopper oxidase domain-containing protein [Rhizobium tibeticum]
MAPSQQYDVRWQARKPAKWLLHCHISHPRRITMSRRTAAA